MLRALEEFADAAYVIACPEGAYRNFEGNLRAKKRIERTKSIIESIGLERERVGLIVCSKENPKSLALLAREIMGQGFRFGAVACIETPVLMSNHPSAKRKE